MKVLMFGWEFPPFKSGGLGTACFGLTKSLSKQGTEIVFVIPKAPYDIKGEFVELLVANNFDLEKTEGVETSSTSKIEIKTIDSIITPYMTFSQYDIEKSKIDINKLRQMIKIKPSNDKDDAVYGRNLYEEVMRYTEKAKLIAAYSDYDVINCHDWMTFRAGIEAKKLSGKPLVCHIHATEFDRSCGGVNQIVYDLEREGFEHADIIVANSNLTKNNVVNHYGIDSNKVQVVHLGIEQNESEYKVDMKRKTDEKTVLFLGRVTYQKGPDYFLKAAKEILKFEPDTKFIVAGDGDMLPSMINYACELGISKNVSFSGFLKGKDVHKAFQMADVYVMPSVSEPYGLTPLESVKNGTPTIISYQSGISEVFNNTLKCDFWDINKLTDKVVGILRYNALRSDLLENAVAEVRKMGWDTPAIKCNHIFNEAIHKFGNRKSNYHSIHHDNNYSKIHIK